MGLQTRNKVNPNFNMSSLTDIIFLLLIFFMLTSTFVTPNALNLLLPSSNNQATAKGPISVSIDENLEYFVGTDKVAFEELQTALEQKIADEGVSDPTVVLNAYKEVPIDKVVGIMNVAKEMRVKIILATQKE